MLFNHPYFISAWNLTAHMAPYLIIGFLLAGLLDSFISKATLQRYLGGGKYKASVRGALFGVPLPLCSCGVLPLAKSMHTRGAGKGAIVSFTASTPQTGVDAFPASVALLGWPFSIVRAVSAFMVGVLCGWAVEFFSGKKHTHPSNQTPNNKNETNNNHANNASCCGCGGESKGTAPLSKRLRAALHYGFIQLPPHLLWPLTLGILIAAAAEVWLPASLLPSSLGSGLIGFALVSLVAVPLYVCSVGSIPIALSLLHAGFSPGAALVFILLGPATNAATLITLYSILGRRSTLIFIITLVLVSWGIGSLMDISGLSFSALNTAPLLADCGTCTHTGSAAGTEQAHTHSHGMGAVYHLSGIFLVGLLGLAAARRYIFKS